MSTAFYWMTVIPCFILKQVETSSLNIGRFHHQEHQGTYTEAAIEIIWDEFLSIVTLDILQDNL